MQIFAQVSAQKKGASAMKIITGHPLSAFWYIRMSIRVLSAASPHESCQIDVPADVVTHDRLCFVIADWCGVCGIHIAGV